MKNSLKIAHFRKTKLLFFLAVFILAASSVVAQNSVKKEKMRLLSFMIGEWIGTTKSFENGAVSKQGAAYQKISYDLDSNILVIELNSEFLQLHTVVYYDEEDKIYYYNPFYKNGAGKYPAKYQDGRLIVQSSEKKRFVFGRISNGGFREYGEELINGKWIKYFEDTFQNSQ